MTADRIIVVEDEMIVALDIQNRLEREGYCVPAIALSGVEAIELAEQLHPDLMIMDIGLQGDLDGIQAAQQISNRQAIPVIFLTAYADINTRERALTVSPAAFLIKPIDDRELLGVVTAVLQSRGSTYPS